MPGRELIKVERVDPCKTVNPSVTSWTVTGETVELHPRTMQFHTINDWMASIFAQGKQMERLVWVNWRSSRFGVKDIVMAELDRSKWEHESEAS